MEELSLDLIGIAEGTDKHSLHHGYLRHYERLFRSFRDEPIELLEIGIAAGASLRTWRRFFSRARIIGVDVNPNCVRYSSDNIVVEIGSQEDPAFCAHLCRTYQPSLHYS